MKALTATAKEMDELIQHLEDRYELTPEDLYLWWLLRDAESLTEEEMEDQVEDQFTLREILRMRAEEMIEDGRDVAIDQSNRILEMAEQMGIELDTPLKSK